ncbi:hypothetical protein [Candidatus Entotheonella palauensis]|uniref:hypothetical protein n=1 Tax=Candidatus Entotheonella palauensis TaxID=93172 RepID=UPI000B7D6038|nr:hypothetical protein [Candidatus Entotheonella palauensis]
MVQHVAPWQRHDVQVKASRFVLSLILVVALMGCTPGSDTGTRPSAPDPNDPQFVSQGIQEVVDLYQAAFRHGDIDRLQPLLRTADTAPAATVMRQDGHGVFQPNGCPVLSALTAGQFRDAITVLLQRFRILSHTTEILDMDTSSSEPTVLLQEVFSLEDTMSTNSTPLAQRTCVSNLTLRLTVAPERQELSGVIVTAFLITEVMREGPIFQVEMPGRVQADALARIEVREVTDTFLTQQVMVNTGVQDVLLQAREDGVFRGAVLLPGQLSPPPLQVVIGRAHGEEIVFQHIYQPRLLDDLVAHRIRNTEEGRFLSLIEARDGIIWAGDRQAIYEIDPGAMAAMIAHQLNLRIEDLAIDAQARLHAVVFSPQRSGVIVPLGELLCQTVNAFDPSYPFTIREPDSGQRVPSASTRAIAASGSGIWLFGSDGGVARVSDALQVENCINGAVPIDYDPIFRRQDQSTNQLLSNTVPAFVESQDGALWFGTALGLTRWQRGQFTPVPFDPVLSLAPGQLSQDQLSTLENFIGRVSAAIFASQPIETVMIGDLSFLDFFGRGLVKEDFIFSAVEDRHNRLWAGTVGGGIRRIETIEGTFRDTLQITREAVFSMDAAMQTRTPVHSLGQLVSNIIFALAIEPDGDVWAATDKGASHIQEQADGTVVITNYTARDGLVLPVRDVLVSEAERVWLATDGGVYQLTSEAAQLQGAVMHVDQQSGLESPVEGADVILQNTPFRAITDARGVFSLPQLPLGATPYTIHVRSDDAIDGPFTQMFGAIELNTPAQVTRQFTVVRREPRIVIDPMQGGTYTFPTIPGSEIVLGPEGPAFPSEIGLTLLPVDSLPQPDAASGLILVVAAELQPDPLVFTQPITLTLPNPTPLPPDTVIILGCLETVNGRLDYEPPRGFGPVSQDGLTSTVTSFEALPEHCPILGFQAFASSLSPR